MDHKARVCRLCFSADNLIDIYDRHQANLSEIIKHIGKFDPSDLLPKYICTICISKIKYSKFKGGPPDGMMKPGPSNAYDSHGQAPHAHSASGGGGGGGGAGGAQLHGNDQMNTPQLSLSDFIADKTATDFAQMFGAGGMPNDQNPGFAPFFNFGNVQRKQDYPNKAGAPPNERTMTWDQFSRTFPWDSVRSPHPSQRGHPNADPGPPPETCEQCGKTFPTRKEAVDHMRREHHVNPSASSTSRYANSVRRTQVQCELCHSWLSNRYALKAHMLRHTSEPKKCPQCDKISPNANALSSHIREVHAERIHKCHLCEKAFKAAVALKRHMLRHMPEPRKCPQCDKISPNAYALSSHIREVHVERMHRCHLCPKSFKAAVALKNHEQRHLQEPVKCPHCDKLSPNANALSSHIREVHVERLHNCHLCPKSFKAAVMLKDHIATHTREKSYKCSYCPEEFIWRSNMYAHQKKCHPMEWSEDRKRKGPFMAES